MNDHTELVRSQPLPLHATQEMAVSDPESILRFAIEKGAGVETIERLMAVRRELKAEADKAAFDSALRDFQAECPIIVKGKSVPDGTGKVAYKYAPLEDVLIQVRPLLQKHGFSFTLDTDTESKDGWVIAKCHVTHCAGHTRESTAKFPLGAGTRIMSTTQVFAAALTFATRRVFCNAFGIVTGGEDNLESQNKPKPDGPSTLHGNKPPTANDASLKRKLVDLTRSIHFAKGYALDDGAKSNLTQYLIDEAFISDTQTVSDLSGDELAKVVEKIEKKLNS